MTQQEKDEAIDQCYADKAQAIYNYVSSLKPNAKINPSIVKIIDNLVESQIKMIVSIPLGL